MAMLMRRGGSGGRRRKPMADINVTPMVDVMLVLLVVFMITAPMLATGVAVNLPKTRAEALPSDQEQPLVVTIDKAGKVYVGTQKVPVELTQLAPQLKAAAKAQMDKRVYVRGDAQVAYGEVMTVLALLQRSGFANAGLPVDSKDMKRVEDILEKGATP